MNILKLWELGASAPDVTAFGNSVKIVIAFSVRPYIESKPLVSLSVQDSRKKARGAEEELSLN